MMKNAIIFDLDGTLIDSMRLWRNVDQEFLVSRGVTVPADLFDHLPHGNSFIHTAQYFKDRFALSESAEEIMQIWTDMVSRHYSMDMALKPGAGDFVKRLFDQGYKIGLGTSNSYELAEKALTLNKIWPYFHAVTTGDMNLMGKPYPDIYLHCAQKLEVMPEDCIVIEDTLSGVQAGLAAGMTVIGIHDPDSIEQHERMKALAHAFCLDYVDLERIVWHWLN
ncbi:MAG TPA: HAD family phosphatase [Candidatus Cloacimonadota bacterium]|nr:HAD family phosphatase [Candidatus Cloacimonadota bacterium]